jgi:hypothetical protein
MDLLSERESVFRNGFKLRGFPINVLKEKKLAEYVEPPSIHPPTLSGVPRLTSTRHRIISASMGKVLLGSDSRQTRRRPKAILMR